MIILTLPYPPSGNHRNGMRGKHVYRLSKTVLFFDVVRVICAAENATRGLTGRLSVTYKVFPPDRRRRDIANVEKAASDALSEAGVWGDDCQIDELHMYRCERVKGGMLIAEIKEIA